MYRKERKERKERKDPKTFLCFASFASFAVDYSPMTVLGDTTTSAFSGLRNVK